MKKTILSLVAGLVAVTAGTSAYAQGLIGTNYYSVGGSYIHNNLPVINKFDVWAAELGVNYNAHVDGDFGVDVGLSGSVAVDDKKGYTWQNQIVAFNATPYFSITPELKVFGTGSIGYSHHREAAAGFRHKDNDFLWGLGAGLEYVIDQLSFIGSANYSRATNGGHDGVWAFGAQANYWLDSNWAISAGYAYLDYKNGHGNEVSAKVRFRF